MAPNEEHVELIVEAVKTLVEKRLAPLAEEIKTLRREVAGLSFLTREDAAATYASAKDLPSQIDARLAAVSERVAELSGRLSAMPVPKDGAPGRDGVDGKSVTPDDVRPMLESMVAAIPKAQDGAPGRDGVSVDMDEVRAAIGVEVARSVAALPVAKDGAPGKDGRDGVDGAPGEKGDPGERGEKGESGADGKVGPAGDRGEKGIDGAAGRDGIDGRNGIDGTPGEKGKDGIDGKDGAPGRDGLAGRDGLPGEKGADGRDGVDGLGIDDVDVELKDDGRTLVLKFSGGGRVKSSEIVVPWQIYRGVWKAGTYQRGDVVTYAGAQWTAKADTSSTPPSDDWQLSVKRGADAK
jgi:integrin beta 3